MKKLKTVKEVCELTGLNRKLLYTYDKEGIVKPSAYQNEGHEGMAKKTGVKVDYKGYKLYDEEAVMKLQQIAIYEKLHIKRSDIKARFSSKKNSTNDLLDEQIQMLQQKKKEIEELLIVAEQLKIIGMRGELTKYYASMDFSELAQKAMQWQESQSMKIFEEILEKIANEFETKVDEILDELFSLSAKELESEKAMGIAKELLAITKKNFGFIGWLTVISIAVVVEGGGVASDDMVAEYSKEAIVNSAKVIVSYLKCEMDLLWKESIEILAKHYDAIGKDYTESKVKKLVEEMKALLFVHTGLSSKEEYKIFFEFMEIFSVVEGVEYLSFTLRAMKYYYKNT